MLRKSDRKSKKKERVSCVGRSMDHVIVGKVETASMRAFQHLKTAHQKQT
jgi:hypothetical protein